MSDQAFVEVEVVGVGHDIFNKPLVLLRDNQERELPIWIGHCEVLAISQRLSDSFDSQRPLTHDLAINLWRRLGAELQSLRIDDLWEKVYYSKLNFHLAGESVDVDCRPSDGIAMALTAGVPIYVADAVMRQSQGDDDED